MKYLLLKFEHVRKEKFWDSSWFSMWHSSFHFFLFFFSSRLFFCFSCLISFFFHFAGHLFLQNGFWDGFYYLRIRWKEIKVGGQWNKIFMTISGSTLHVFLCIFSGLLDKIMLIQEWFERSLRGTQRQFSENICSEDDLRSKIFETYFPKFLACLPLPGFSNI